MSVPSGPILLLDCSQRESVVGLARGDGVDDAVLERRFVPAPGDPKERLWLELDALVAEAGVAPGSIAAVAVATGPGGFTGLRVSIALAQGLALSLGVRAVGLPSPSVFARARAEAGARGPWIVALAAKDGSAWCATVGDPAGSGRSGTGGDGVVEEGAVLDPVAFAALVSRLAPNGVELVADGHLPREFTEIASAAGVPQVEPRSTAAALAAEARTRLARPATDPATLLPAYAREPEAVAKWRARHPAAAGTQELRDR